MMSTLAAAAGSAAALHERSAAWVACCSSTVLVLWRCHSSLHAARWPCLACTAGQAGCAGQARRWERIKSQATCGACDAPATCPSARRSNPRPPPPLRGCIAAPSCCISAPPRFLGRPCCFCPPSGPSRRGSDSGPSSSLDAAAMLAISRSGPPRPCMIAVRRSLVPSNRWPGPCLQWRRPRGVAQPACAMRSWACRRVEGAEASGSPPRLHSYRRPGPPGAREPSAGLSVAARAVACCRAVVPLPPRGAPPWGVVALGSHVVAPRCRCRSMHAIWRRQQQQAGRQQQRHLPVCGASGGWLARGWKAPAVPGGPSRPAPPALRVLVCWALQELWQPPWRLWQCRPWRAAGSPNAAAAAASACWCRGQGLQHLARSDGTRRAIASWWLGQRQRQLARPHPCCRAWPGGPCWLVAS